MLKYGKGKQCSFAHTENTQQYTHTELKHDTHTQCSMLLTIVCVFHNVAFEIGRASCRARV